MPKVVFSANLQRHLPVSSRVVQASDVRTALDAVFQDSARLRSYIVDERGALRRHVAVYVNGQPICDRDRLTDSLQPNDEVHVFQALSGG